MAKIKKQPVALNSRTSLRRNMRRHWELYVLILPVFLYFVVFKYLPMYGIQIAFKDYYPGMDIMKAEWIGLTHFQRVFRSSTFWTALKNTLVISVMRLTLGFPLPIILALILNELRFTKMRKLLQTVTYAPHFISAVAMAGIIMAFTQSGGIVGQMYTASTGETVDLLTIPEYFKWIFVVGNEWKGLGWSSIIYVAALSGIDTSLYDAAKVDGANRLQRILYLEIPSLVPTMVILLILDCGKILGVGYEQILLLQNSLNITASEVISTYSYRVGMLQRSYGFSTALGLFNSVVNLTLLTTVNKISKKVSGSGLW